ncbi:hypothetical protein IM40_02740 [Candidatus Paracaedimonas acanthamoebae]|nr:hypothetical protein IM40_02740 [Candidatus Paracaedimonas acanthamoebae]
MKNLSIIFSTLFSVSSHLVHASTMLEDHRDSPIPSPFQTGVPAMSDDDLIAKLFTQKLTTLITQEILTEDDENRIKKIFTDEKDFIALSNHGWEAEQTGNFTEAFYYRRAAALGNLPVDQEKLAYNYLDRKDYKSAARWYVSAALNHNDDVLSELHRINKTVEILEYLTLKDFSKAMSILEEYWKSQDTEG